MNIFKHYPSFHIILHTTKKVLTNLGLKVE